MVAEIIMIVIDNSEYVRKDSVFFRFQLEAIRLYCRAKIKSNPENRVGLGFMRMGYYAHPVDPTSDIEYFLTHTLENVRFGGELGFLGGLIYSMLGFVRPPTNMKKRMLVFAGCPDPEYLMDDIRVVGQKYNHRDIAVDVVSFACDNREWDLSKTRCLEELVALADKDNNSHFAYVPAHVTPDSSSVLDFLVSSKILSPSEADPALSAEEGLTKKKKKKNKKKKKKLRKKKDHHSQEDPEEEPVPFSSSEAEARERSPRAIFPDSVQASLKEYKHEDSEEEPVPFYFSSSSSSEAEATDRSPIFPDSVLASLKEYKHELVFGKIKM